MNTNYSAAQLMHFAEQGLLEKFEMAHLLPPATEVDFLRACEDVEKALTRGLHRPWRSLPGIGLRDGR